MIRSISELAANNNLDLAVTEPKFDEEKQNYKKVVILDNQKKNIKAKRLMAIK